MSGAVDLRQTVVEVCDVLGEELSWRFGRENTSILVAMHAFSRESDSFFDPDALLPLFNYAKTVPLINKLSERLLSAEYRVFKSKIEKFYDEGKQNPKIDPLNTATSKLLKFFKNNNTPIVLSMLFKLAVTARYTQCPVECLFSAVTRVASSSLSTQNM